MALSSHSPATPWWRRWLPQAWRGSASSHGELLFPPGFLESLERLKLLALKAGSGGVKPGQRLGAHKGGQLEFHDHRAYSPGDDLRYVDWSLYARLGRLFVKEFAREEAGRVHIVLDASPSMNFGAPSKWVYARRLAAAFAHIAWATHDDVTVFVSTGTNGLLRYPPPGARPRTPELLAWLEKLEAAEPVSATTKEQTTETFNNQVFWSGTSRAFLRLSPPRGRVLVISDFLHEETDVADGVAHWFGAGYDVSLLQVLSPQETELPPPGELRVWSPEEITELEINATEDVLTLYKQEMERHAGAIEHQSVRRGGNYLRINTAEPLETSVLKVLKKKRWVGT